MEMAKTKMAPAEFDQLVDNMFTKAGLNKHKAVGFEDFKKLISNKLHRGVTLQWKGIAIGVVPIMNLLVTNW